MTPWQRRPVQLAFELGDRRLLAVHLNALVRQVWLTDSDQPVDVPVPPTWDVPDDCAGMLIRSMPLARPQPRLRSADGFLCYVRKAYQRYFIDLTIGFDAYEGKFSSKTRSTIRRKVKKLADQNGGRIDFRRFGSESEIDEFFALAHPISGRTYQQRLFQAGLPESDEFRAQARQLARNDAVRAYILLHAGKPSAYLYCPVRAGALIYEYLGYLPEHADHSVGTVLQWLALRDLFAERRFRLFDFTEGESEHKRLFSTGSVYCGDVYFFKRRLGVAAYLYAQMLTDALSAGAGRMLDRVGLRTRLRRFLRFGTAS